MSDLPEDLARRPAPEAVRLWCRHQLDRAAAAADRMEAGADDEALHDFRVALRRLRSTWRAHAGLLGSGGKKRRRALRALGRRTNTMRDAEVRQQLQRAHGGADSEALARAMEFELGAVRAELGAEVVGEFRDRLPWLLAPLTSYEVQVPAGGAPPPVSFAVHSRSALRKQAKALLSALASVATVADEAEIHAARIDAKRLRYLLEPLRGTTASVDAIIGRLRDLQDALGDIRDQQTAAASFDARDPQLADSLRAAAGTAFTAFAARWGAADRRAFAAELKVLAAELAGTEVEVQRRFLLTRLPALPAEDGAVAIDEGWLPGENLRERLRRSRGSDGVRHARAVGVRAGVERIEVEEEIAPDLFDALWPLTAGRRVCRRHHRVADGDLTWEVDEFQGRDLVLAAVEGLADREVSFPAWLAPCVVREVTGEAEFGNASLAGPE